VWIFKGEVIGDVIETENASKKKAAKSK
jgi:small subunit ribosomal protein S3